MNQLYKFTSNGKSLLAVLVPEGARNIELDQKHYTLQRLLFYEYNSRFYCHPINKSGKFSILGEITREPTYGTVTPIWKSHTFNLDAEVFIQACKDFETQTGLLWKNPMGCEPKEKVWMATKFVTTIEWDKWEEAESRLIPQSMKVVILNEE